MRIYLLLLLSAGIAIGQSNVQSTAITVTAGTEQYAKVTVCASALCSGGLTKDQIKANSNLNAATSWRMVDDGTTVIALFVSSGYTYTINRLFVGATQDECVVQAKAWGLTIPDAVLNPQNLPNIGAK